MEKAESKIEQKHDSLDQIQRVECGKITCMEMKEKSKKETDNECASESSENPEIEKFSGTNEDLSIKKKTNEEKIIQEEEIEIYMSKDQLKSESTKEKSGNSKQGDESETESRNRCREEEDQIIEETSARMLWMRRHRDLDVKCLYEAIAEIITVENIMACHPTKDGRLEVLVRNSQNAIKILERGIRVNGITIQVFSARANPTRITLENVPPFITDSRLLEVLSKYGRVKNNEIQTVNIQTQRDQYRHIVTFKKTLWMDRHKDKEIPEFLELEFGSNKFFTETSVFDFKCPRCCMPDHALAYCNKIPNQKKNSENETKDRTYAEILKKAPQEKRTNPRNYAVKQDESNENALAIRDIVKKNNNEIKTDKIPNMKDEWKTISTKRRTSYDITEKKMVREGYDPDLGQKPIWINQENGKQEVEKNSLENINTRWDDKKEPGPEYKVESETVKRDFEKVCKEKNNKTNEHSERSNSVEKIKHEAINDALGEEEIKRIASEIDSLAKEIHKEGKFPPSPLKGTSTEKLFLIFVSRKDFMKKELEQYNVSYLDIIRTIEATRLKAERMKRSTSRENLMDTETNAEPSRQRKTEKRKMEHSLPGDENEILISSDEERNNEIKDKIISKRKKKISITEKEVKKDNFTDGNMSEKYKILNEVNVEGTNIDREKFSSKGNRTQVNDKKTTVAKETREINLTKQSDTYIESKGANKNKIVSVNEEKNTIANKAEEEIKKGENTTDTRNRECELKN